MLVFAFARLVPHDFAMVVMWSAVLFAMAAVSTALWLLAHGYGSITNILYTLLAGVPTALAFVILFKLCCGTVHF